MLTSGTLSPLDSFSSELGAKFPVSLESPHVVNMQKQVLAGVLSTASNGLPLKATYQQSSKPEFMDGVGEIILSMCSTVPDGLLVFFSSYNRIKFAFACKFIKIRTKYIQKRSFGVFFYFTFI